MTPEQEEGLCVQEMLKHEKEFADGVIAKIKSHEAFYSKYTREQLLDEVVHLRLLLDEIHNHSPR